MSTFALPSRLVSTARLAALSGLVLCFSAEAAFAQAQRTPAANTPAKPARRSAPAAGSQTDPASRRATATKNEQARKANQGPAQAAGMAPASAYDLSRLSSDGRSALAIITPETEIRDFSLDQLTGLFPQTEIKILGENVYLIQSEMEGAGQHERIRAAFPELTILTPRQTAEALESFNNMEVPSLTDDNQLMLIYPPDGKGTSILEQIPRRMKSVQVSANGQDSYILTFPTVLIASRMRAAYPELNLLTRAQIDALRNASAQNPMLQPGGGLEKFSK